MISCRVNVACQEFLILSTQILPNEKFSQYYLSNVPPFTIPLTYDAPAMEWICLLLLTVC